jgi:hypothetical protein
MFLIFHPIVFDSFKRKPMKPLCKVLSCISCLLEHLTKGLFSHLTKDPFSHPCKGLSDRKYGLDDLSKPLRSGLLGISSDPSGEPLRSPNLRDA